MPYKICPECSKEFYVKPSRPDIQFCSTKCRSKNHRCFVPCKNCGKKFEVIKSRQNKAAFCSIKCREDFWNKFHRIIRFCLNCGKKFIRKKYREKQTKVLFCSVECANKYLFKDKPFSKKHCQDISKALTGKPKSKEHIKNVSQAQKGQHHSPKTEFKKGNIPWLKGKKDVYSSETIEKMREARLKRIIPKRDTVIEVLLQNELKQRGIEFQTHLPVEGICQPDIVFLDKKIVIEADGNYWHSLPKSIVKDRRNNKILRERGWKVFRFSETEIKNNVKECINQIEQLFLK